MTTRKISREEYLTELFTYYFDEGGTVSQDDSVITFRNSTDTILSQYHMRNGEAVYY